MNKLMLIPGELKAEIDLRIAKVQEIMKEKGLEAMLVASNANIYYLTGRFFRGYIFVPAEGLARWFVVRPAGLCGSDAHYVRKPEQIADELAALGVPMPGNIGLEMDVLSYSEVMRLEKCFPTSEAANASPVLKQARMVKTDYEVELMREDGRHQAAVYHRIPRLYKDGMTDLQFQIEIERLLRIEGSLGYYRVAGNLMEIHMGSVVNGENADNPSPYEFAIGGAGADPAIPGGADGTTMLPGTTVMVDVNGCFNGYQTDMTRTWSIGRVGNEALKAHECSREILRMCEREGKPGVPVASLYEKAMAIVHAADLDRYFMGYSQKAGFMGHGVGIELNELPVVMQRSRDILQRNMTIALEPKFIIPHIGAVGIENTYVVTDNGMESLTEFPEELAEI